MTSAVKTGIYFGYAQVHPECPSGNASDLPSEDLQVFPMVMSIGWNPFYKNEKLTAVLNVFLGILVLNYLTGSAYHPQIQGRFLRTCHDGDCAGLHSPRVGLYIKRYMYAMYAEHC